MDYTLLASSLRDETSAYEMTAFPDGSVDTYYRVYGNDGDRIESRLAFSERIAADADTFSLTRETTRPGGQAVNVAQQLYALDDTVRLFGHLDDPLFEGLPFETVSMGPPASVSVYEFDDGDLMLSDRPADSSGWSLDELRTAAGDAFRDRLTADAVCCVNWISFDGMTDALARLAALSLDGGPFVFDAGDVVGAPPEAIETLCTALDSLDRSYDVYVSANGSEIEYLASVLDAEDVESDEATLDRLRRRIDVTGVVRHGKSEATAATADGRTAVSTIDADGVRRQTGAGDRFGAGFAHGLAADWSFERALGLGNLCSSYYFEHGETGTRDALAEYADTSETN